MQKKVKPHIILVILAILAAGVLFTTYGTVLPAAPLTTVALDTPTAVDSDGKLTAVVDSESRRALILNSDTDLTGVVSCTTVDCPIEAITDVCTKDDLVYLSGVKFAPDSDSISLERVVTYDKGGNFQGIVYEKEGDGGSIPRIKSLNDAPEGVVVANDATPDSSSENESEKPRKQDASVELDLINTEETRRVGTISTDYDFVHDVAYSAADEDHYAILNTLGELSDGIPGHNSRTYANHVFTAIDVGPDGFLYACDDVSGALCMIEPGSSTVAEIASGEGYNSVHVNNGVISLCNSNANSILTCNASGEDTKKLTEAKPSIGFSARMMLVWASGIYLAALAIVLAVRKIIGLIKSGKTEGMSALFTAIAVTSAIAVAIGSLSFSSYQSLLNSRTNEINMCADYLASAATNMSKGMEQINDRNALHSEGDALTDAVEALLDASTPPVRMVDSATANNIGMYCTLYGKDDKGIFYLFGSSQEYVMGSSAQKSKGGELEAAFAGEPSAGSDLLSGHTLRDATLYRLVQVPSTDGKTVVGVIEIGSRMRSFEASILGNEIQCVLALLVMVFVVYLAYSELRACGRCLLSFRQRQHDSPDDAAAMLTRPFSLAIMMLAGIDSVMTVLIARDMLAHAGISDTSPLLAVPAVMLGAGLVIGQALYGYAGPRIGLRRLIAGGAAAMLLCALLTGLAVLSNVFWLYCAAKLIMSIPFGMLNPLAYSLPRLAESEGVQDEAKANYRRTETSAAALGTILGGYAAQALGNVWVYIIIAVACLPVILMALNLLPRGMRPLEAIAQPARKDGHIRSFAKTRPALAIAFLMVLPLMVAAGYASFLFPLFSADLGLSKSDINNIVVLGQLIVYISINSIERAEAHYGVLRVTTTSLALLGAVFLLFSVNTTLAWSVIVIALVGLLDKSCGGWKSLWLKAASNAGVATGKATSALFTTRSLALVAQPFILGALLGVANSVAVIVIGIICVVCAALFFLATRSKKLG